MRIYQYNHKLRTLVPVVVHPKHHSHNTSPYHIRSMSREQIHQLAMDQVLNHRKKEDI